MAQIFQSQVMNMLVEGLFDQLPSLRVALIDQPLDEPPDPALLRHVIDELGSDELLMFSTVYPHWHVDRPEEALPAGLPDEVPPKILAENARSFYRL